MRQWGLCLALIAAILMVGDAVSSAAELAGVDIHGFVSQGYLESSDNNYLADTEGGTFQFNEMAVNFSKEFGKLRIGTQIMSRDLGEFGNNDVVLDWAVGDYRYRDWLGLRIGKVKIPMGFYNQGRDVDMLRVPVLLPSSVYDEGSRELVNAYQGAGIYGLQDFGMVGEFDYELLYGTTDVDQNSIYLRGQASQLESQLRRGIRDATVSGFTVNTDYIGGGALRWATPLDGLRLGFSYQLSEHDYTGTVSSAFLPRGGGTLNGEITKNETMVGSFEFTWNNLVVAGEYSQNKLELTSGISGLGPPRDQSKTSEGWYVQTTYQITDWFLAGIYYSEFYPDKDDKSGDSQVAVGLPDYYAWQKDLVPTLRFDIGNHWVVKAEAHFVDGAAQVYDFNNPDGREGSWTLYALKATFSF